MTCYASCPVCCWSSRLPLFRKRMRRCGLAIRLLSLIKELDATLATIHTMTWSRNSFSKRCRRKGPAAFLIRTSSTSSPLPLPPSKPRRTWLQSWHGPTSSSSQRTGYTTACPTLRRWMCPSSNGQSPPSKTFWRKSTSRSSRHTDKILLDILCQITIMLMSFGPKNFFASYWMVNPCHEP